VSGSISAWPVQRRPLPGRISSCDARTCATPSSASTRSSTSPKDLTVGTWHRGARTPLTAAFRSRLMLGFKPSRGSSGCSTRGASERSSRGARLAGGRSTPVDHAGRPLGSRVPLRTPIGERDADLRGEHRAETSVQLGARRYSDGVRAFARSRSVCPPNLAEAARSRSQIYSPTNFGGLAVYRSPGATPRGFCFFGQSSRASAPSLSSAPLSATIARDHERRPRRRLRGRERSLWASPGREPVRAFNGSGVDGGGVQQCRHPLREVSRYF